MTKFALKLYPQTDGPEPSMGFYHFSLQAVSLSQFHMLSFCHTCHFTYSIYFDSVPVLLYSMEPIIKEFRNETMVSRWQRVTYMSPFICSDCDDFLISSGLPIQHIPWLDQCNSRPVHGWCHTSFSCFVGQSQNPEQLGFEECGVLCQLCVVWNTAEDNASWAFGATSGGQEEEWSRYCYRVCRRIEYSKYLTLRFYCWSF